MWQDEGQRTWMQGKSGLRVFRRLRSLDIVFDLLDPAEKLNYEMAKSGLTDFNLPTPNLNIQEAHIKQTLAEIKKADPGWLVPEVRLIAWGTEKSKHTSTQAQFPSEDSRQNRNVSLFKDSESDDVRSLDYQWFSRSFSTFPGIPSLDHSDVFGGTANIQLVQIIGEAMLKTTNNTCRSDTSAHKPRPPCSQPPVAGPTNERTAPGRLQPCNN
ncbi:hypothetical protein B7463_g7485, partial [Scytalidium lignicola]